ncbi:MAG: hypothetical protein ACKO3W_05780, partial [bacterium]
MQFPAHPRHIEEDEPRGTGRVLERRFKTRALAERGSDRGKRAAHSEVRRLFINGLRGERIAVRGDRILAVLLLDAEGEVPDEVGDGANTEV